MNKHFKLAITLIFSCLFLIGCSTKLTYNFLDWWLSWNVKNYISLDREQRKALKGQINDFHHWHRNTELPRYSEFLLDVKTRFQQAPMTESEMNAFSTQLLRLWQNSLAQLVAPSTQLIATLSDQQAEEFLKSLSKRQEDLRDEYVDLSAEELIDHRIERMEDFLKTWIGRLSRAQKVRVHHWATNLIPNQEMMLNERERWQAQVAELLKERDTENLEERIRRVLLYPENRWSEAYRQNMKTNRGLTISLLVDVNNSLSEKQQQKRDKALQRYIDDFRELSDAG